MFLVPVPLLRRLELALLAPQLARAEVEAGCAAAIKYDCLAVIVKPAYIEVARKALKETRIKVVSVIGFPHGGASAATKMYETQDILQRGAEEIAMVINVGALRDREDLIVRNDITGVVKTSRGNPVTVILETGMLTDEEKVRGCKIAEAAKAAFVQNMTGFCSGLTSPADIQILRAACPELKTKAAGDIESLDAALAMIGAGAERIVLSQIEKVLGV
jgi:deoxyribose-phosphate aldolase